MNNRRGFGGNRAGIRGYSERITDIKDVRDRFLIVCEGEKTEPNYFRKFRTSAKVIVHGVGMNTSSLIREAIRLKGEDDYDQVWCVFDRDSFPLQNFNQAIEMAKANDIQVAYSNEAFELWYLLHFDFHQSGIPRADYINILGNKLGKRYKKNSQTIYEDLEDKMNVAIRNAERLLSRYESHRPVSDNPSTTVHLLVQQLLRR